MSFEVLDIVILFGGVQALSLCFYLLFRKVDNKQAHRLFILFLFSIALYNIGYTAIFMNVQIGSFGLGSQPVPYKYMIAPSLFGYFIFSLHHGNTRLNRIIWLMMIPAILYGIVRVYWVYLILSGSNPKIIREVFDTGFFTINEIAYLVFSIVLGIWMLKERNLQLSTNRISFGTKKNWTWLKTLPSVFVGLNATKLVLVFASLVVMGEHTRIFYYPALIINSLFVYWIGFTGYTRPNLLFFNPLIKDKPVDVGNSRIQEVLDKAMSEKVFKNPKLTSQQLASELGLSMTELTRHINSQFGINFSHYLNQHRTEEAIRLMKTELSEKFTLEALALEAGFNSKSSFYKIFKEQTGLTPSAYIKSLDQ